MAFRVQIIQEENPVILLTDDTSETCAEIFAFGAILNRFCVQHQQASFNVIDGFENLAAAKATLTPMFNSAKLSPFVCRVKNHKYHFGEQTFHLDKYALGKHAIHGLIYDAVFSITENTSNDDNACVKLQHVYSNDSEGFPFTYRCEVSYTLKKNNELVVKTSVTNIDEQLLPIADGWHPYFKLHDKVDECQLEFQSKEMMEFDEGLIPTGRFIPYQEFGALKLIGDSNFDNCFTVNFAECQPMCVFRNPAKKIQVEIHPSQAYPYLQIFTPGHRNSIAIENLSAAPDAFNNALGLKVLEPGETAVFLTKYIIRAL